MPEEPTTSQPAAPQCPVGLRNKRRNIPMMSLGYIMTHDSLCAYATKRGLGDLNPQTQVIRAISLIRKQVKGGMVLLFVRFKCPSGGLPFLAIATNMTPELMAMGTPARIQALKSALEMDDDPKWHKTYQI